MKKKSLLIFILTVIFVIAAFVGFLSINVEATATCTPSGNIGDCVGECCKLTKTGCIAGPCSAILK
jgi:uncharacterized membrane protein